MKTAILALVSVLWLALSAWADGKRPWTVEDSIELSSFVQHTAGDEDTPRPAPIVSPDGRSFLLVTERGRLSGNRIESTIWKLSRQAVADYVSGKSVVPPIPRAVATLRATSNTQVVSAVRWLDAERIAFLGKDGSPFQRLFVADLKSGTVTPLTPADRFVSGYDVRGETIAYTSLLTEKRAAEAGDDLVSVRGKSLPSLLYPEPPPLPDLDFEAVGSYATALHVQRHGRELPLAFVWRGKPLRLFASAWSSAPPLALSPDGSSLITLAPVPEIPAAWSAYRPGPDTEDQPLRPGDPSAVAEDNFYKPLQFVLVDLKTGGVSPLVDAPAARSLGYIVPTQAFWRADGRQAVLVNTFLPIDTSDAAERKRRAAGPFVTAVDVASRALQPITPIRPPDFHAVRFYRITDVSWNAAEDALTLTSSSFPESRAPAPETYRLADGKWLPSQRPSGRGADDDVEILVDESFDRPPVLVGRRRGAAAAVPLWDPNPQLAGIALGKVSLYKWKSRDGSEWSGLLALPPGYDPQKRYPLVIQTHGYSLKQFFTDGVYTTANGGRALTAKGIVVLQMEMSPKHLWTPADAPFELGGFEAAVEQLAKEGVVDPRRVGVIGFSFTCFHALYALTHHPDLFAAAAITDGNQMSYSQYLTNEPVVQQMSEATNGGLPWGKGLASWAEHSPDFNLDKVRTPLLISALERGQLLRQWEPYAGLYRLGKPVDLLWLRQEDAPHVLVQPRHRYLSQQSAVDWFDFWLNNREDPDPAKAGSFRSSRQRALCFRAGGPFQSRSSRPAERVARQGQASCQRCPFILESTEHRMMLSLAGELACRLDLSSTEGG